MDEVLNYRLGDSAGGLWRRLWSIGYTMPNPLPNETARQWIDRTGLVRDLINQLLLHKE